MNENPLMTSLRRATAHLAAAIALCALALPSASLVANGVHGICVGRRGSTDNTDAAGRVILREGGKLVLNPSHSS